jgi:hypothetical protein
VKEMLKIWITTTFQPYSDDSCRPNAAGQLLMYDWHLKEAFPSNKYLAWSVETLYPKLNEADGYHDMTY